jgi:hypothetical protein
MCPCPANHARVPIANDQALLMVTPPLAGAFRGPLVSAVSTAGQRGRLSFLPAQRPSLQSTNGVNWNISRITP